MSQHTFARASLLLVLAVFVTAVGCQQSGPDQKGQPSAKARQVTVDLTGMT